MSTITQQIFNSFGEAFSYAIDITDGSPENFSKRTKMDKGRVSKYINNKTTPRPKTVNKIVQLLGIEHGHYRLRIRYRESQRTLVVG